MHPELFTFQLFGKTITLYSYGAFLLLALVLGILVLYWQLSKRNLVRRKIFDNILWTILGGIFGARLFFVLFHFGFYLGNPKEIFRIWHGGLDFYGAFISGFIVLALWLWVRKREEFWAWLDSSIIALVCGFAVGTVGSFLLGSGYGRPSDLPWAVTFPVLSDNVSRHPTQIYEFAACSLIFIFLILLSNSKKIQKKQGFVFFFGLILFSTARFVIEFFKVPDIILFKGILEFTSVHLLSFLFLICGVIGVIWKCRIQSKEE